MKKHLFLILAVCLGLALEAEARMSLFSSWTMEERKLLSKAELDQSAGLLFAVKGIPPPASSRDADFILAPYQISYGLEHQLELGAAWGFLMNNRPGQNNQLGITDLQMGGRYVFMQANRAERTPGLDVEAGLSFPTGSFARGLGTGALGFLTQWGLVLPLDPVQVQLTMGYRINLENSDNVRVGNIFSYSLGAQFPAQLLGLHTAWADDLSCGAALRGANHTKDKINGETFGSEADELYFAPGARYRINQQLSLESALLVGLTSDSSDIGLQILARF